MTSKDKLVPVEPTLVVWVLYDATEDKEYIKMNPADGSLAIFDSEEAAIAAKKTHYGTDYKRCEYYSAPAVQEEPVGWQYFQFGTWMTGDTLTRDQQNDIKEAGHPIRDVYATPQPAPEVAKLVEALERITNMDSMSYHSLESAKIVAREAITAYRKGGCK